MRGSIVMQEKWSARLLVIISVMMGFCHALELMRGHLVAKLLIGLSLEEYVFGISVLILLRGRCCRLWSLGAFGFAGGFFVSAVKALVSSLFPEAACGVIHVAALRGSSVAVA